MTRNFCSSSNSGKNTSTACRCELSSERCQHWRIFCKDADRGKLLLGSRAIAWHPLTRKSNPLLQNCVLQVTCSWECSWRKMSICAEPVWPLHRAGISSNPPKGKLYLSRDLLTALSSQLHIWQGEQRGKGNALPACLYSSDRLVTARQCK